MGELSKGLLQVFISLTITSISISAYSNQCSNLFGVSSKSSSQIKIGTYNLLNLYMHSGNMRKENSGPHEKPRWAIEQMGRLLKEENYDIFVAQEVESIGSAKKFNAEFLGNQYNVFSTTTLDVRGLHVVFFVKKNLPYHFKIESHAQEKWFDPLKGQEAMLFERDLPTLHIYKNSNDKTPILTMLGVHFKSKRDRFGPKNPDTLQAEIEVESTRLREAQANRATQIIQRYQIQFGYEHPILMAGDFNSNHNYAPEFAGFLRHTKLSDTVGLKKPVKKYSERTTHSFFGSDRTKHNQLDGILITPSLVSHLQDSYVVKYRDERDQEKDIPRTKQERKANPSDHRPITAVFSFENPEQ